MFRRLTHPLLALSFFLLLFSLQSPPITRAATPTVIQLAAGQYHTCALLSDETVQCWGDNAFGQLGDGSTTDRTTPVAVLTSPGGASLTGVTQIAAGQYHTCATATDQTVRCWGLNADGQLGDGTTTNRPSPVAVLTSPGGASLSGVTQIAAGGYHTCALLADQTVQCWGLNLSGQLGDGTTTNRPSPVAVLTSPGGASLSGVTQIAAGGYHTCALLSDETVKCWGYNDFGQLGDGSTTQRTSPVPVLTSPGGASLTGVTQLAAGGFYTCALLTDQTVRCWGANAFGQLGDGTTTQRTTPVPVLTSPGGAPLSGVTQLAAGSYHTCALLTDQTVKCWGYNFYGQLGDGTTTTPRTTPVPVLTSPGGASLTGVTQIAAGGFHTCALLTDQTVKCWGLNDQGQLGDGTTTQRTTPVPVVGFDTPLFSISGTVTDAAGDPLSGVTVDNGAGDTDVTDSNGEYTITGLVADDYTVTATLAGRVFTPASIDVTVGPDATGVDFQEVAYDISGTVTDADGAGLPGVTVSNGAGKSDVTDTNGEYTLTNVPPGNYTITPTLAGRVFTPSSQGVNVTSSDLIDINFAEAAFTISGTVTTVGNISLAGVTVSNGAGKTDVTDSNGDYTITGVVTGSYTVTATLAGYTFLPASQNASVGPANATAIDFATQEYTVFLPLVIR